MARVTLGAHQVELVAGETVLDGLRRVGARVAASCEAGVCHTCVLRVVDGRVPPSAQRGLPPGLVAQDAVLPCVCVPEEDLALDDLDAVRPPVTATITRVEPLPGRVVRVVLDAPGLSWAGGQYVHLARPDDGLSRPYSIASLPGDPVELHVARVPGGRMSRWLAEAEVGTPVTLRGPAGACVYVEGEPERPLVLAGLGTGLAPLLGVLRSALAAGHAGPVHLFVGARSTTGHYLKDELTRLSAAVPQLHLHLGALAGPPESDVVLGLLDDAVLALGPTLRGARCYAAGAPPWVRGLQRRLFLAGAALGRIHADAFETAPPPRDPPCASPATPTTPSAC